MTTISRLVAVIRARGVRRLLLSRVLPIVLVVPLVLQILLADIVGKDPRLFPPALRQAKSLLVVTAHPDDECLFFSPAILGVLSGNPEIAGGLVVLSTGELRTFPGLITSHDI
jgi:N-acetylglucosaminylphosphatidylinositol deacetylase